MSTEEKSIEEARELSLQSRARGGTVLGGSLLELMARANEIISPWWSRQRDQELEAFARSCDHIMSATGLLISKIVSLPVKVLPRDPSVKAHVAQADEFTIRLFEESDFGAGWVDTLTRWLLDFWLSDNGGFLEIIGQGERAGLKAVQRMSGKERRESGLVAGPIIGMPVGIAHLDSHRCIRTGDPEYPVLYKDTDGVLYKLHTTRVAFASDLASPRAEMHGVGFCALSRCINTAQRLIDMSVYYQEKLGSRPKRGIIIARRISGEVVQGAFRDAEEEMDNRGLRRFSMVPIIADLDSDASLELLELARLPDGFDEETSTRLGMFLIAMAWGVPIRWIWPAAVSGATRADAEFQHTSGLSGGLARTLRIIEYMLGGSEWGPYHSKGKFLPPHLKLSLDVQDDWEDRQKAEIRSVRTNERKVALDTGVISVRVAREQALASGDITRAQFEQLELEDGRLPDGSDVLTLFSSTDPFIMKLLDLGFEEPLAVGDHDAGEMLAEIEAAIIHAKAAAASAGSPTEKQKALQAIAALESLRALYSSEKRFTPGVSGKLILREASKVRIKKQANCRKIAQAIGLRPEMIEQLARVRSGAGASDELLRLQLVEVTEGKTRLTERGRALLSAASLGDEEKAREIMRDLMGIRSHPVRSQEENEHRPLFVDVTCPLCKGQGADYYPGHKGLLVCRTCKRTFDPSVE